MAAVLVPTGMLALTALCTGTWWLWIFCVPGFLVFAYWSHGKILLLAALFSFKPRRLAGVLVTSDSPNWKAYIEEHWLKRFPERFVVLNFSRRKEWRICLATRLYGRFCSYEENFCPAIILLRGLRYPLIYRFFYAFRDHKHGNESALRALEQHLEHELGLR